MVHKWDFRDLMMETQNYTWKQLKKLKSDVCEVVE